uniref:KRAB domain-containing protein n=1 Tax=Rhinolophus ferrumequinum TaxID=59479 RepID=A0A671F9F3_RHIFE
MRERNKSQGRVAFKDVSASQLPPGGCQELDSAQKILCWDVMLENDSSLVSMGCHDQTKCVSQLEQEEPWITEVELLVQSLPHSGQRAIGIDQWDRVRRAELTPYMTVV